MTFKPVDNPVATIALDEPIQAMGVEIREIAIRAPTAGDLFVAGNPVLSFEIATGVYRWDERKAMAMLSRLSGIPYEGSLERLTAEDAVYCWEQIGPFFVKGLRKMIASYREWKAEVDKQENSTKQPEPAAS